MPELNYKASNIARAEREYGFNFFAELGRLYEASKKGQAAAHDIGFTSLMFILAAGGLSEQEADEMIDSQGLEGSFEEAGLALVNSGFLAKMKDNPEVKKQLEKLEKTSEEETSQDTGKTTKA